MNRAVTVPPAVRAVFVKALAGESPHAAALPEPLPMGRVLKVRDKAIGSEDEPKVLAGENEKGFFLDPFPVRNDRPPGRPGRLHQDDHGGTLENFEGQFGFPLYRDDPAKTAAERQRILDHNTRVGEVLRAKGFK